MVTLGQLAVQFGCELQGDPDAQVDSVATLQNAGPRSVSFLANLKYRRELAGTHAGAVLLQQRFAAECPVPALVCSDPYATYARVAALLHPPPAVAPGVHPSAVVDPQAVIAASASVGPGVIVEAGVRVGERSVLGPRCVLMRGAEIGADCRLVAAVTVCPRTRIGARVLIHPGAVIGSDGFGFAPDERRWVKIPQLGGVRIDDDVEIGANTTIDCGAIDDTVIESGVKLDNQIQIGHNVRIGAHTVIAGCSGVSGSTVIGRHCIIGGMVGIAGHLVIGDGVQVTGATLVSRSLPESGVYSSGWPAEPARSWRRTVAALRRLAKRDDKHEDEPDDRNDPRGDETDE